MHSFVLDLQSLQTKEQDSFQIDLEDPRFSAMYESAKFAVDPSHPQYK